MTWVIFIPQPFLCKKIGSKWSLNSFLQGRALKAPPPTQCPFQRPLLVGLKHQIEFLGGGGDTNTFIGHGGGSGYITQAE